MMEIKIEATGDHRVGGTGKTYMLGRIKQLLEDKDFSVSFPGEKCDVPHEHMLVATRSDDWVKKNIANSDYMCDGWRVS